MDIRKRLQSADKWQDRSHSDWDKLSEGGNFVSMREHRKTVAQLEHQIKLLKKTLNSNESQLTDLTRTFT